MTIPILNNRSLRVLAESIRMTARPDRELDAEIWCAAQGFTLVRFTSGLEGFVYSDPSRQAFRQCDTTPMLGASLDAITAFSEIVLPGVWWLVAKGRMREAEPIFGARLFFGQEVIAEAEHDTHPALALALALVEFLAGRA